MSDNSQGKPEPDASAPTLSERECAVLTLVADGKTDAEISIILGIAPKTVNYHVEKIKRRFGVATRIQAVVFALRRSYIV